MSTAWLVFELMFVRCLTEAHWLTLLGVCLITKQTMKAPISVQKRLIAGPQHAPPAVRRRINKVRTTTFKDEEWHCGRFFFEWNCYSTGDQYCGGRLDKPSGTFKTPNWPEKDYPAGVTCSWHIVAPKNQVRMFFLQHYTHKCGSNTARD